MAGEGQGSGGPSSMGTGSDPRRDHSSSGRSHSKNFQRGKGGRGRGDNRSKKRDMGRSEWSKTKPDKRGANEEAQAAKRQKLNNGEGTPLPVYATQFAKDEIDAEERRPKKKVAVMIGYSGTGYRGMQLAPDQKTIEGDLFKAFVAAGAISKANADDPKKSSFVRCARTDKGVHAAGNVISLKLIVEDEDIIKKINDALTPQIRVWGYERTNNSFSSYQLCDSRIYEYLIPTHSFLPPHPRSYLGRKCREWAEKKGDLEDWEVRQAEVKGYWEKVDEEMIKPILEDSDESIRDVLEKALWLTAEQEAHKHKDGDMKATKEKKEVEPSAEQRAVEKEAGQHIQDNAQKPSEDVEISENLDIENGETPLKANTSVKDDTIDAETGESRPYLTKEERIARRKLLEEGVKRLRAAYVAAKRQYRIPEARRERLQTVLNLYLGTKNFWNYTIQKGHRDPSAKRVIKSFKVNPEPILINGTEWLSLKVHGQSFMMHQIRKMVGMAALVVRCGCDPARITESYGPDGISIPKAPSLGLLLERPVFDSYNKRAQSELAKEAIDFDKYRSEMDTFKQEFIYERMYEDEERDNVFGNFFTHIDSFPSGTFLFVTSGGLEATREEKSHGSSSTQQQKREGTGEDDDRIEPEDDLVDSDDELDRARDNAGDEG